MRPPTYPLYGSDMGQLWQVSARTYLRRKTLVFYFPPQTAFSGGALNRVEPLEGALCLVSCAARPPVA